MSEVQELLTILHDKHGYTNEDIAHKLSVSTRYIGYVKSGKKPGNNLYEPLTTLVNESEHRGNNQASSSTYSPEDTQPYKSDEDEEWEDEEDEETEEPDIEEDEEFSDEDEEWEDEEEIEEPEETTTKWTLSNGMTLSGALTGVIVLLVILVLVYPSVKATFQKPKIQEPESTQTGPYQGMQQ